MYQVVPHKGSCGVELIPNIISNRFNINEEIPKSVGCDPPDESTTLSSVSHIQYATFHMETTIIETVCKI
jgi:hypothetical protein